MEAQRLYSILGSTSSMLGGFTPQNIYQTQGPNGGFGGFYDASNGFGDAGLALGQGMNPSGIAGRVLGGVTRLASRTAMGQARPNPHTPAPSLPCCRDSGRHND